MRIFSKILQFFFGIKYCLQEYFYTDNEEINLNTNCYKTKLIDWSKQNLLLLDSSHFIYLYKKINDPYNYKKVKLYGNPVSIKGYILSKHPNKIQPKIFDKLEINHILNPNYHRYNHNHNHNDSEIKVPRLNICNNNKQSIYKMLSNSSINYFNNQIRNSIKQDDLINTGLPRILNISNQNYNIECYSLNSINKQNKLITESETKILTPPSNKLNDNISKLKVYNSENNINKFSQSQSNIINNNIHPDSIYQIIEDKKSVTLSGYGTYLLGL
ncbi:uncharacterized protein CMU_005900 [Cryptosporidium muris RN66]|uniref:Uncharacterized protein n=1 Tax=Cryptosporidium muris (strain RN66) TaxID=441375 RepID=B6AHH2_CRYMR|nr:uncharacterized protein CMU_005900 [Cryptosporidium muris RN66]EEA07667.1 hypothetical protein, conserved [Cryptosporidium muris RN66]|eukprot:XP_002142016.1 hypothetical protein [Cryptosporidium muris RN66]